MKKQKKRIKLTTPEDFAKALTRRHLWESHVSLSQVPNKEDIEKMKIHPIALIEGGETTEAKFEAGFNVMMRELEGMHKEALHNHYNIPLSSEVVESLKKLPEFKNQQKLEINPKKTKISPKK